MTITLKLTLLLLLVVVGVAGAHEFWLAPSHFFLVPGEKINLHVFVGQNFTGTRWLGKSPRLARFVQYSPTDSTELMPAATQRDTLSTNVSFQQPGTHLLAFTTNNAFLTLPADSFNVYLKKESLSNALLERQQRSESTKPGREAYRRCAKTLVQVGGTASASGNAFQHVVGLPLELVPEQNPYALATGAALTVRVLADGRPLPGALVQVWQRQAGQVTRSTKLYSNQNGRVLLRLSVPGNYLISTVRMVAAADRQLADWQSTWSSLTFGFNGRPPR